MEFNYMLIVSELIVGTEHGQQSGVVCIDDIAWPPVVSNGCNGNHNFNT